MRGLFLISLRSWENRRLTPGGAERNAGDGSWFVLFSVGSRLCQCIRTWPSSCSHGLFPPVPWVQISRGAAACGSSWMDTTPRVSGCSSAEQSEGFCLPQGAAARGITARQQAARVAAGRWNGKAVKSWEIQPFGFTCLSLTPQLHS